MRVVSSAVGSGGDSRKGGLSARNPNEEHHRLQRSNFGNRLLNRSHRL
jgi:hypothetical protein